MSDNYRDGCPPKRFGITWLLVQVIYVGAWLSDPFNRRSEK
jgi:hypothetical protein